ncbi:MAG: hypothetical protein MJ237_02920 [bacterium]|nr:hypothetical protein [bacterium]
MVTKVKKVLFDPGFGPYIMAFQGSLEYLYGDINRFRNLSQKKMKFMQYHNKILELFYNNIGFYTGCLLWASYIKSLPESELEGNYCLGKTFNEDTDKAETQYLLKFVELFPKDMKYYLSKKFEFDKKFETLLKTYEEFSLINKGFCETKTTADLLLPNNVKTENQTDFKELVENAISKKDLSILAENITDVIEF